MSTPIKFETVPTIALIGSNSRDVVRFDAQPTGIMITMNAYNLGNRTPSRLQVFIPWDEWIRGVHLFSRLVYKP